MYSNHHSANLKTSRGSSLTELIIALGLGLGILAMSIQLSVDSKSTYYSLENNSQLQTNGRYTLDFLGKSIKLAGFKSNLLISSGESFPAQTILFEGIPVNFQTGQVLSAIPNPTTASSDTILIRHQGHEEGYTKDCNGTTIEAEKMVTIAYFVENERFLCSVYDETGTLTHSKILLVKNIEKLHLRFGIMIDAGGTTQNQIQSIQNVIANDNWDKVRSVQVAVVSKTEKSSINEKISSQTISILDEPDKTVSDNHQRSIFSETINVKNIFI